MCFILVLSHRTDPTLNILFSFLAVYTALCTDATYSFICEDPAPINWENKLCYKLLEART